MIAELLILAGIFLYAFSSLKAESIMLIAVGMLIVHFSRRWHWATRFSLAGRGWKGIVVFIAILVLLEAAFGTFINHQIQIDPLGFWSEQLDTR